MGDFFREQSLHLFRVRPDDPNLRTGMIDATHKWGLPGVICPRCGSTWGNVGLDYPAIDLSSLANEKSYRRARAVDLKEFVRLREPLARLMDPDALLLPGTQFGPLVGDGKGKFTDFAWLNLWTLLVTRENLVKLNAKVPNLQGIIPELTFRSADHPQFLELYLPPQGELALPAFGDAAPCTACGRDGRSLPDHIAIVRSSISDDIHLFRTRNFTTLVFATDRFVKAVQDLNLVGLRFEEAKILD